MKGVMQETNVVEEKGRVEELVSTPVVETPPAHPTYLENPADALSRLTPRVNDFPQRRPRPVHLFWRNLGD